jgi:hypothetical protein
MPRSTAVNTQRPKSIAPFGEADGQRMLIDGFVSFKNIGWGGIATSGHDFGARVLVGRKGSGKTVYLRRLHATAADDNSNLAEEVQYEPPDTETILSFSRLFSEGESYLEWWAKLWKICILRSLASHVTAGRLSSHTDARTVGRVMEFAQGNRGRLLRQFAAPISAYRQMDEIVNTYHNRNSIVEYLQSQYWADLETILAGILEKSPPIFWFLDALDEHFERSPRWWLKCQEGLFYQCVQFSRSAQWNRLHLTVSLRDIVFASMMRSEHRSRFTGDSHIRLLNWKRDSIEEFFRMKLEVLEKGFFLGAFKLGRTIENWLGTEVVVNEKRQIVEPIGQYLLRHTRLLPRDVVIIGNRLCGLISRHQESPLNLEAEIRRHVHEAASVFGREQFQICANEIVSAHMPRCGGARCQSAFVGNDDFTSSVAAALQVFVRSIGTDRFPRSTVESLSSSAREKFDCDVFSLMWRNGLIGYVDPSRDEKYVFYDHDSLNSFELPAQYNEYVFHPIVIDATGIKSEGKNPVIPYL